MKHFGIFGAALVLLAIHLTALAQAYPERPIRLIVPFPAGEAIDVTARLVAQRWSALLGQQIIVDNRVGAGGVIGTELASKASADGYVLLLNNVGPLAISPGLYRKPPYDALRDFAPISQLTNVPFYLFVSPAALPVTTAKELIAYAKNNPGKVNYASTGVGSGVHLAGELFRALAKIDIVHVPYKGVGQALPDLVAGKIQTVFYPITFHSYVKQGKLRALMITATERSALLPDVPTSAEIGMPEMLASSWHAVVAPAGVPAERIKKLHQTLVAALSDKEVRERLTANGADPVGSSPAEFDRFRRAELAKWRKVIEFSGAKID